MSVPIIRSYEWIHHTGMKRTEMIKQIEIYFQVVSKEILLLKNSYIERKREKEFSMSKEEEKQARLGNTC